MIQLSYQKRKKFPKIFRHAVTKTHYFVKWNFSHLMFLNWCQTAHTSIFSPNYTFFPIKSDKNKKLGKKFRHAVTKTQISSKIYFCFTLKPQNLIIWSRFTLFWLIFIKSLIKKKKKQKKFRHAVTKTQIFLKLTFTSTKTWKSYYIEEINLCKAIFH